MKLIEVPKLASLAAGALLAWLAVPRSIGGGLLQRQHRYLYHQCGAGTVPPTSSVALSPTILGSTFPASPKLSWSISRAPAAWWQDPSFRTQPRDGSVVALLQRNNLYLPLVSDENKEFDPREVNWIGSLNRSITPSASGRLRR